MSEIAIHSIPAAYIDLLNIIQEL
uniref:Uncharacterized protein n=1 Tax=Anopheles funestus TaxID=62324 RepID=A0A182S2B5_ANOFN